MVYVKMLSNLKKRYDARFGGIGWRLRPPPGHHFRKINNKNAGIETKLKVANELDL
jgi:hypothetical protein